MCIVLKTRDTVQVEIFDCTHHRPSRIVAVGGTRQSTKIKSQNVTRGTIRKNFTPRKFPALGKLHVGVYMQLIPQQENDNVDLKCTH